MAAGMVTLAWVPALAASNSKLEAVGAGGYAATCLIDNEWCIKPGSKGGTCQLGEARQDNGNSTDNDAEYTNLVCTQGSPQIGWVS